MKLEYLDNISAGSKYKGIITGQLVRLYDFDSMQANIFRQAIQQTILTDKRSLHVDELAIIDERNCNLTLQLADSDLGITTEDAENLYCDLTVSGYENMVSLLAPFCNKENNGYQWLYDVDNDIEFLFASGGK